MVKWEMIIWYIQKELANGYEPDENGVYCFNRKDILSEIGGSISFFDNNKGNVLYFLSNNMKMINRAKYEEDKDENLFLDVTYDRGKIKFRKNPIYDLPKYSYLWAMAPTDVYFTYDYFDDKHRRRCDGQDVKAGAYPWSWSEEEIQNAKLT